MDRGTAKERSTRGRSARRSRRHRRRALVACALTLLALPGAAGCGESGDEEAAARARAAAARQARLMAAGREVFAEQCASCHTIEGRHYTKPVIEWEAPNLDEVRLKRKYVEYRLEYGGPAMPSFRRAISEQEVRAVIAYVTETAGRNVTDGDPPADELAAGREVFAANCARCHGIEGNEMTGDPVYRGVDFNLVKPSPQMVRQKARHGIGEDIGVMPSFGRSLSDEELDAVAAYVNAVAAEGPEAPRTPFESLHGQDPIE